jgi:hypothetical protein
MANLLDLLTKRKEKRETVSQQEADFARSAEFYFKGNPEALSQVGLTDTEFKNLSAREKAVAGLTAIKAMEMARADAGRKSGEQAAQQKQVSAAALARVLQDAGSLNEQEVLAEGRGPVRQTRRPVAMTPQRLQTVLARNPAAVNAENFAPNINALRALLTDTTASADAGMPESATMGESDVIFNRKTGQFQISPFSKAAANKKEAEGYIELPDEEDPLYGPRIRLPLSQARDKYPHLLKRLESGASGKAASQYPDANAVKAALKAGQIKKDEAIKILREQFGYK